MKTAIRLIASPRSFLTISSGILTIPSVGSFPAPGVYRVLPQSGTADDLIQINGGIGHEELIMLRVNTVGHVITVIHTPPNLRLATATFLLNSVYDHIAFRSPAAKRLGGRDAQQYSALSSVCGLSLW